MEDTAVKPIETKSKKRAVWHLNILATLLLLFSLTLSSLDGVTRLITILCHTVALGTSYFSLRRRFTLFGLLLIIIAAYLYALHLIVLLEKNS
ncbi:MAG: hypothetical protein V4773_14355 [Verrucomicrobiota bacterium]